jgi:hypothetical protein
MDHPASDKFDRSVQRLPRLLGQRTVRTTDVTGIAGLDLMLRVPERIDIGSGAVPYVCIKVHVLLRRAITTAEVPGETIYLVLPIREPVFELTEHGLADSLLLAGTPYVLVGSGLHIEPLGADRFPRISLKRPLPFGETAALSTDPVPNQHVYLRIFDASGTDASGLFHLLWEEVTTGFPTLSPPPPFSTDLAAGTGILLMPRQGVVGTFTVAVTLDPTVTTLAAALSNARTRTFSVATTTDFPASHRPGGARTTFFTTEHAFQRRSLAPMFWPGAPATGARYPIAFTIPAIDFLVEPTPPATEVVSLFKLLDFHQDGVCVPSRYVMSAGELSHTLEACHGESSRLGFYVEEEGTGHTRSERALLISDARARLVDIHGAPIERPLIATDVIDPKLGTLYTVPSDLCDLMFYIEAEVGDIGDAKVGLLVVGTSLLEARLNEGVLYEMPESGQKNTLYTATQRLEERAFAPSRQIVTSHFDSKPGHLKFGPFLCCPQLRGTTGEFALPRLAKLPDGTVLIAATDAIGFSFVVAGFAPTGAEPDFTDYTPLPEFRPMFCRVRSLEMAISTGDADLPALADVRPELRILGGALTSAGEPIAFQLLDALADATGTAPRSLAVRIEQLGSVVYATTPVTDFGASWTPGPYSLIVTPTGIDWSLPAVITVEATNALGNTARLIANLQPAPDVSSTSAHIEIKARTAAVEPAILRIAYEAPTGTTLPPAPWTVNLTRTGPDAPELVLDMHAAVSGRYLSRAIVVGRVVEPLLGISPSLALIELGEGEVLRCTTTAAPGAEPDRCCSFETRQAVRSSQLIRLTREMRSKFVINPMHSMIQRTRFISVWESCSPVANSTAQRSSPSP